MKIETPKSFEEFKKIFCETSIGRIDYYRGQSDYSWDVVAGLARNTSIKKIANLISIENKLIGEFKKKIVDKKFENLIPKTVNYDKSWVSLMTAQHYGLPTRLLDFSHDKYSALEFAVADITNLNKDGVLIIYKDIDKINENVDSQLFKNPFTQDHQSFFFQGISFKFSDNNEEKLSERRKIIQGSKFLYTQTDNIQQCLTLNKNHSEDITIIHIPKNIKIDIIKWLIEINKMAYDLYAGKNIVDYYSAILKNKFNSINDSNIDNSIGNDDFWRC